MLEFGWWSRADWPPGGWDLRYDGWLIRRSSPRGAGSAVRWPILVDWRRTTRPRLVLQPGMARGMVVLGVDSPAERALLMKSGFGEALGGDVEREELVARVSRDALLADVWRLDHDPESNRLEVHVSRLRSKLAVFRLSWLVATDPRGGYRLHSRRQRSAFAFGMAPASAYERAIIMPGGRAHRDRQQEGARADAGAGERQGFGRT